jgi:hypothetical protein
MWIELTTFTQANPMPLPVELLQTAIQAGGLLNNSTETATCSKYNQGEAISRRGLHPACTRTSPR